MSKRLGHLVYRIAGLIAAAALGLAVYVAIIDGPTNNRLPISLTWGFRSQVHDGGIMGASCGGCSGSKI